MKVLVIDPVSLFHHIMEDVFEGTGIEAILCDDMAHGLEKLQGEDIDFICVSMHLPDGDGISFCKKIRQIEQYHHIPLILFTSDETENIYRQALSSGVTEVFHKKDVQQLVTFINRFTAQQQPFEGRILYVEDTLSQQRLVTQVFEGKGLKVDAFESGEEAWKAYQKQHYDLVVTDIVLDGKMSGMALINYIRRIESDKGDVPILAITGFDDISRRIDLFYLGVSDYVIKPIVEEELVARVRNLIKGKQYLTEVVEHRRLAEKADIAKSEFLANMSHELRTPMHGVISFARFGIKKFADAPREKLGEYFVQIENSAQRLMMLLNDLLDLAKLESGKMEMDFQPHDLSLLINTCLDEQRARLEQNNIKVKIKIASTSTMAEVDSIKMTQVIANLLSNAIKFSPINSSIYFKVSDDNIADSQPAIKLSIRDEGKGIPENELESVFDKFIQSGDTMMSTGGTGLGLTISKEIIEGYKGKIFAENVNAGGACFSVIIPVSKS